MKEFKYIVKLYRNARRRVCLFDTLEDVAVYLSAFDVEIDVDSIKENCVDDYQPLWEYSSTDVVVLVSKISYVPHVRFERLGV